MIVEKVLTYIALILIFSLAIGMAALAFGDPINGQDYLAAQHKRFNISDAKQSLKPGDATGNLDWTFGEDLTSIETLLNNNPRYHRVHFFNGPCIRGGNCGKYEISRGYNPAKWDADVKAKKPKIINHLKVRAALYRDICARHPLTQCLASPELEHNLSKKGYRVLADTIREVWPQVQLVNSPVGGIQIEPYLGAWIERHGTKPQSDADIVSTDGEEVTDTDIQNFLVRTNRPKMKIRFSWSRVYNCRNQGPFQDPRTRKSCPKTGNLKELAHIFDDRGIKPVGKPQGCESVKPFQAPNIWKPMAEDNGSGDFRANRPVALIKNKASKITVIASNGEDVGNLPMYKDPVPHNLERYYSALGSNVNGYEFEVRAKQKSGNPYVYLRLNEACLGPLATGRRAGVYK